MAPGGAGLGAERRLGEIMQEQAETVGKAKGGGEMWQRNKIKEGSTAGRFSEIADRQALCRVQQRGSGSGVSAPIWEMQPWLTYTPPRSTS